MPNHSFFVIGVSSENDLAEHSTNFRSSFDLTKDTSGSSIASLGSIVAMSVSPLNHLNLVGMEASG